MKEKQSLDKMKQDKLISSLSQTLTAAVHAKLDKVVRTEMKNAVLPGQSPSYKIGICTIQTRRVRTFARDPSKYVIWAYFSVF